MSRPFFAQLDENNVVTTVHCVTQQFLEANPNAIQALGLKPFLTRQAKLMLVSVTHMMKCYKILLRLYILILRVRFSYGCKVDGLCFG
jgi:hypothetical protein